MNLIFSFPIPIPTRFRALPPSKLQFCNGDFTPTSIENSTKIQTSFGFYSGFNCSKVQRTSIERIHIGDFIRIVLKFRIHSDFKQASIYQNSIQIWIHNWKNSILFVDYEWEPSLKSSLDKILFVKAIQTWDPPKDWWNVPECFPHFECSLQWKTWMKVSNFFLLPFVLLFYFFLLFLPFFFSSFFLPFFYFFVSFIFFVGQTWSKPLWLWTTMGSQGSPSSTTHT